MKTFFQSQKGTVFILILTIILSGFLALYKFGSVPPTINADEIAFGYNAYSILNTGSDEYGTMLPVRLKSFGDYKMPLYTYLSIPFVSLFGMNDFSIRFVNILIACFFPIVIYFLTKELFTNKYIAYIAAVLISVNTGKGIIERHAHEALLASFLITVASYFYLRYFKSYVLSQGIYGSIALFLALFSYQSSRVFALYFFVYALTHLFIKHKLKTKVTALFLAFFIFVSCVFVTTDLLYKPTRVQQLFLTNTAGFAMKIDEFRREGGSVIFYNKLTIGVRDFVYHYLSYFSPQFVAINGDSNYRFGYPTMAPMTVIEYLFVFIGIYFLFRNREKWRYYLLGLLFITPVAAALSWADTSMTRTVFMFIPLSIISAYGAYSLFSSSNRINSKYLLMSGLLVFEILFLFYSWDFYFNHYPKRAVVTRAWQGGYKELGEYIKANYQKYDTFYITKKNGEPYIFLLYYLQYPPKEYQKQAHLTDPDEYGFGQVEKFDKFVFQFPQNALKKKNAVLIGFPDDFNEYKIDQKKVKKITVGHEEIFWIYEL